MKHTGNVPLQAFRLLVAAITLLLLIAVPLSPSAQGATQAARTGGINPAASGPWLIYDIAIGEGMGTNYNRTGGATFAVLISADGGPFTPLWQAEYGRFNQWFPYALNLSKYAGKTVRIRLMTRYPDHRINSDYPYWGNPRIVVGSLTGAAPPKEVFNFALTPIKTMGGLLPEGTIAPLNEPAQYFGYQGEPLVTPGMVNRKYSLMVYAGDNYITVTGKAQPGIFMGFDMSHDWAKYGGDPNNTPYTGPMPPPVFAEWTVTIPAATDTAGDVPAPPVSVKQAAHTNPTGAFQDLTFQEDRWGYAPGLAALYDPKTLTLRASMGPQATHGWAFAGVETLGLKQAALDVQTTGRFTAQDANSFGGLLVDYHTARGYQKRLWVMLGAGSAQRTDLRPGSWILDAASFSRAQRLTFVNQFVDISGQIRGGQGIIPLPIAQYAPPDWDGRVWLGIGVQNLGQKQGLVAHLRGLRSYVPNPEIGSLANLSKLSGKFLILNSANLVYALSRTNGALCGVWDRRSGRRLVSECLDRYHQERRTSVSESTERFDRVTAIKPLGGLGWALSCTNQGLPGVLIEKRYVLAPDQVLAKRVGFTTSDKEGFFLRWINGTNLDANFLAQGTRGGALASREVMAKGKAVKLTEEVKKEQAGIDMAPMVILNDYSEGIASYRYHVNDRFVMRGGLPAKTTRTGWDMGVFTDYLKAGKPISAEARWVVFAGDFITFERYYQHLPEYQAIWNDPQRPTWMKDLVCDEMYTHNGMEGFVNACQPQIVTGTMWFLNGPWGNWGPDHKFPNAAYSPTDPTAVYHAAPGLKLAMPNLRVSQYHNFLFDTTSDIYKQHPEFGVRDREGELVASGINSDSSRGSTFYFQIDNPKVRQHLLNLHQGKIRKWGLDFLYFDGPGIDQEEIDWGSLSVAQSYDWLAYLKSLRNAARAINPKEILFLNGVATPYTDIGYIEFTDPFWNKLASADWRSTAQALLTLKVDEPKDFTIVPTYGDYGSDPPQSAYDIMYGWCGNLAFVERLPWMRAAWEYRGSHLEENSVTPQWWRSNTEIEAYGLRKGGVGLVNIINHAPGASQAQVTVDTGKLGLPVGKPLYAYVLEMNQTPTAIPNPADPGNPFVTTHAAAALTARILFWGKSCPAHLTLRVPTRPGLLSSVVLSPVPAVLENVYGRPTETGALCHRDITITNAPAGALRIDCRTDTATLLIPGHSLQDTAVIGSASVENAQWCGKPALRVNVKRGVQMIRLGNK